MNRLYLSALLLFPVVLRAGDKDSDQLGDRIVDRLSCFETVGEDGYVSNPAMQFYRPWKGLSDISAGWSYAYADNAVIEQEGRGHSLGTFDASSFLRLSGTTAVYGRAVYKSGYYRDIKWNNTADYSLLRPYVLGDSVGGDMTSQLYAFSGGYAGESNGWTWGAELGYRAEIDYRNRDPRIKVIVSDLNIKAGVTRRVSDRYAVGLSAGMRIYNQESDLEFYNPLNSILTYALTGLGTYYQRFSGNSNENSAYSFLGFDGGAQIHSVNGEGFSLNAGYSYYNVGQILRDYNNLTLTNLSSHKVSADGAWTRTFSNFRGGVEIKGFWNRRLGTENIFGSPAGNNYKKISSRTFYYNDVVDISASIPVEWRVTDVMTFSAVPSLRFRYDHESYRRPARDLEWRYFAPALTLGYVGRPVDRWVFSASLTGSYVSGTPMNCRLTGLDSDGALGGMVLSNYEMASSDVRVISVGVEADHELTHDVALYCRGDYCREYFGVNMVRDCAAIKVGVKF